MRVGGAEAIVRFWLPALVLAMATPPSGPAVVPPPYTETCHVLNATLITLVQDAPQRMEYVERLEWCRPPPPAGWRLILRRVFLVDGQAQRGGLWTENGELRYRVLWEQGL